MTLEFKKNEKALTLGVEIEFQLLDSKSFGLVPIAPKILNELKNNHLTKEMFRSTLELITGVCDSVADVHRDLSGTFKQVKEVCSSMEIALASTGTHPFADYNNRILSPSSRYAELMDRHQWLIRRMAVYGLHVHIGMRDGDACILFNNFFLRFIPHLIALSASSPFWKGRDTGLDASRPTTYEAHPTSGSPVLVENWHEFNELYRLLLQTSSIQSMKDIWWDLRPSPKYGTLEIRICDAPATMIELESIVAWIHLLALWFEDHKDTYFLRHRLKSTEWVLRENKWRAIRFGLGAELIDHESFEIRPISSDILFWLDQLKPYTRTMAYEKYEACIRDVIANGNSATRQRRVFGMTKDLCEVVRHNNLELETGIPIFPDKAGHMPRSKKTYSSYIRHEEDQQIITPE